MRRLLLAAAVVVPFSPLVAPTGQCLVTPLLDGTAIVEVPFGTASCAIPVPAATASAYVDDSGVVTTVLASGALTLTGMAGDTVVRLLDGSGTEIGQLQVSRDIFPVQQGLFTCATDSPPTC